MRLLQLLVTGVMPPCATHQGALAAQAASCWALFRVRWFACAAGAGR
jgi:hypothetical protein